MGFFQWNQYFAIEGGSLPLDGGDPMARLVKLREVGAMDTLRGSVWVNPDHVVRVTRSIKGRAVIEFSENSELDLEVVETPEMVAKLFQGPVGVALPTVESRVWREAEGE